MEKNHGDTAPHPLDASSTANGGGLLPSGRASEARSERFTENMCRDMRPNK